METTLAPRLGRGLAVVDDEHTLSELVKQAMRDTTDPRLRQVVDALVDHLHAFLREVRPSDEEFEFGLRFVAALGHATNATNNEVVLAADVLGLSTLVTLMNNGITDGRTPGALLGPFYRGGAPSYECGDCVVQGETPGLPFFVTGQVRSTAGEPLAGALVEAWQASPVGLYDNQDPSQPDKNLRGAFRTDAHGRFHFRSVRPAGYPVPTGPRRPVAGRTEPASLPPRTHSFHRRCAGLSHACHAGVRRRFRASRVGRDLRRAPRTGWPFPARG